MAGLKFEITKELGVISENAKGWTKELNMEAGTTTTPSSISVNGLPITPVWARALH